MPNQHEAIQNLEEVYETWQNLTVELLAHKYRYYVQCRPTISDYDYDKLESRWLDLGLILGIDMDSYEHWVDFDVNHPLAIEAMEIVTGRS